MSTNACILRPSRRCYRISTNRRSRIMISKNCFAYPGKILFCTAILIGFLCPATVQAKTHHKHHKSHHAGVDGSASYADIVIDAETGRILHATDPDEPRHPASLTKMMTLYLT